MKQVKIWLAVCPFSDELYLHYMYEKHSGEKFCNQVIKVIQRKCELFRPKHNYFTMSCVGILKEGETYESILQALEDLQISMLPDNLALISNIIVDATTDIEDNFFKAHFYNPNTRIITITDFGGE